MAISARYPPIALKWSTVLGRSAFCVSCCSSKSTLLMDIQSRVRILCSTMYTNCTSKKFTDEAIHCQVKNDELLPKSNPAWLGKREKRPPQHGENISSKAFGLSTDMNSRVLQLFPVEIEQNCAHLPAFVGIEMEKTLNEKDTFYALERLAFRVLQSYNKEQLPQSSRMEKLDMTAHKKGRKDIEPADDPKQKIRRLEMKLRNQLPSFFSKGSAWHDFSIYTPGVELSYTARRYGGSRVFRGLPTYRRVTKSFRFLCKFCLREPRLEILSMICHEDKKMIEVRWRVVGVPYYLQLFSYLLPLSQKRIIKYYDYMSVLSASDEAKVWRHDISKLRPAQSSLIKEIAGMRKNLRAASAITPIVRKSDS